MAGNWRIHELMELVGEVLAVSPAEGQASGRVRDVPDVRTIRYYTTIGLIDRPAEMRGRTAFYGPRHLKQLVAIKRLQAQGMSLVEVQAALVGASPKRLDQLAALPPDFLDAAVAGKFFKRERESPRPVALADGQATGVSARSDRFWASVPDVASSGEEETRSATGSFRRQVAVMLPLDAGITLVLEQITPDHLSEEVVASLEPAIAMLREALARAGLSQRSRDVDAGQFDHGGSPQENRNEP